MLYVHPGPSFGQFDDGVGAILQSILSDTLGRGSVPLLSIISGYLAVRSLAAKTLGNFWQKKFLALMMPVFIWSCLFGVVYALLAFATNDPAFFADQVCRPNCVLGILNATLGVNAQPLDTPLYLLRELFIASLLLPLIYLPVARWKPELLLALSLLLFFFYPVVFSALDLDRTGWQPLGRLSVQAAYAFGVYLAVGVSEADLYRWSDTLASPAVLVCAGALVVTTGAIAGKYIVVGEGWGFQIGQSKRALLVILFWGVSIRMACSRLAGRFDALSTLTFLAYCSHYPLNFIFGYTVGAAYAWDVPNFLSVFMFVLSAPIIFVCVKLGVYFANKNTLGRTLIWILNGGRPVK